MNKENVVERMEAVENTTDIMVNSGDIATKDMVAELLDGGMSAYSSLVDDGSRESKIDIYNAISNPDEKIADHINEVLEIVDVVAHPLTLVDEETGEVVEATRTVLIDKNNKCYEAVSGGIVSALSRIFQFVGRPDGGAWHSNPVKMKIVQVKTRNGNNKVNTIQLVK